VRKGPGVIRILGDLVTFAVDIHILFVRIQGLAQLRSLDPPEQVDCRLVVPVHDKVAVQIRLVRIFLHHKNVFDLNAEVPKEFE